MFLNRRGFTLIESLVGAAILTSGLVGVAWMFAYSAAANRTNHDRTIATLLLEEKLGELKATPIKDLAWNPGDYFDHPGRFLRNWQIRGDSLKTLTVVVLVERSALTHRPLELVRATTMAAP